jgi:hypothetical protein
MMVQKEHANGISHNVRNSHSLKMGRWDSPQGELMGYPTTAEQADMWDIP